MLFRSPEKRLETVVQYDTVYKSVVIEKPIYKTSLLKDNKNSISTLTNDNTQIENSLNADKSLE